MVIKWMNDEMKWIFLIYRVEKWHPRRCTECQEGNATLDSLVEIDSSGHAPAGVNCYLNEKPKSVVVSNEITNDFISSGTKSTIETPAG